MPNVSRLSWRYRDFLDEMQNDKWETCEILEITVRDGETRETLLGFGDPIYVPGIYRWAARTTDSSGSRTIHQSEEYQFGSYSLDEEYEYREAAYQKLIAYLSSEGWEPAATNHGAVTLMKRQIANSGTDVAADSVSLLQQLANLRDAGILTEQEFQTKKVEILKRM